MSLRLSHSGQSKYITCAEMYRLHYIERLRSKSTSSALVFGAAMDNALNYMLLNKDIELCLNNTLIEFMVHWKLQENNSNIDFFKSDFDNDLVNEILNIEKSFHITHDNINYHIWLSLAKKAELLLIAYYNNILPEIKEVIEVQKKVELLDDDGNNFNGIVDAIVRLQDGRVVVMDNKTSSPVYKQDSVAKSEQLAMYQEILNIYNEDPANPWKHKIEACAYAVMSKKLNKTAVKTCKSCGHVTESSHNTCNNTHEVEGTKGKFINARCNGEWSEVTKITAKTQFIVGTISDEFIELVLENATLVKSKIEDGIFPRNYDSCNFIFGKPCIYRGLCHNGDDTGLITVPEREK